MGFPHHVPAWSRKRPQAALESSANAPSPKRTRDELLPCDSPGVRDGTRTPGISLETDNVLADDDQDVSMSDAFPASEPEASTPKSLCGGEPVICFGAIGRLPCGQETAEETGGPLAKKDAGFTKTRAIKRTAAGYICVAIRAESSPCPHHALYTDDGDRLATLDTATSRGLDSIGRIAGLGFQGVIRPSDLNKGGKNCVFALSINVFGPQDVARHVSEILTALKAYLQHPYYLDKGIEYLNPQVYHSFPGTYMTHLVGITEESTAVKALSDEIESALESLVPINLSSMQTHGDITTELKAHQRQAIDFIQRREDPGYCRNANRDACRITGASLDSASASPALGGIIADTMGMGKTLSIITAIIASRTEARSFVLSTDQGAKGCANGPTLVVVPSVQLLDVWMREIEKHVKPDCIKITAFHGRNRPKSSSTLLATGSDIVLTTFSMVAADCKRDAEKRVLQNITWYRLVLDEAHWIRNKGSQWFKAAKTIDSRRRWCLTGTPVQNSLDDLASLVNFLGIQPFAQKAKFKHHITDPLAQTQEGRCTNLKALLASMCLRRGSRCLDIPAHSEEHIDIDQSPGEMALREAIEVEFRKVMSEYAGGGGQAGNSKKRLNTMFDTMTKMRRLANHGTFQKTTAASGRSSGPRSPAAIEDLDSGPCEQCSDSDVAPGGEEFCYQCGRRIGTALVTEASTRALLTPSTDGDSPAAAPPLAFNRSGHSSKLRQVVEKIQGYPLGDKSIVFSSWNLTLDILEHLLGQEGIRSLRIDGTVASSSRAAIIEKFGNDVGFPVLLMTLGTGAVGLTITAANRVHLIEPQWNPFVEEQAIARAVRMGQEKEVTVVRYVVKGSVEKNIMSLKERKRNLARVAIDSNEQKLSGKLKDLRFVLDLDDA